MKALFDLTDKIKTELENNPLINQVTFGDLFEVDLLKKNIYPLAHVGMQSAQISGGVAYVDISILFLDIVDEQKQAQTDQFYGNDNEHFVLNNMFAAATKTVQELMRGDTYSQGFQVEDDNVAVEFFSERFEDKLAGVGIDMTVTIKNTLDLC
jgi:hypothetical protein|tara:strand:+ start:1904 stop:2362 length:459 start_codon:yes stop_codon:yes gene_type:complete